MTQTETGIGESISIGEKMKPFAFNNNPEPQNVLHVSLLAR